MTIANVVSLDRARRLRSDNGVVEPVIAKWKCRRPSCMTQVGVTQSAFDALAVFNAQLKIRRERAIEQHEVMYCDDCAAAWHETEQLKTRGKL